MFLYFLKNFIVINSLGTLTVFSYLSSLVNSCLRPVKIIFKVHFTIMLSP